MKPLVLTDRPKWALGEHGEPLVLTERKEEGEKTHWEISEMEADHITPWIEGGKTVAENCQMLCMEHDRRKSSK